MLFIFEYVSQVHGFIFHSSFVNQEDINAETVIEGTSKRVITAVAEDNTSYAARSVRKLGARYANYLLY